MRTCLILLITMQYFLLRSELINVKSQQNSASSDNVTVTKKSLPLRISTEEYKHEEDIILAKMSFC